MLNNTMHAARHGVESVKEGTMHTLETAKHGVESAKESTTHAMANAISMIVKGVNATSDIFTMLRKLDRDDGLAWFGLARRRSPLVSVAIFGAGVAVGAGIAVLFTPMSGADLRRAILDRASEAKSAVASEVSDRKPTNGGATKAAEPQSGAG